LRKTHNSGKTKNLKIIAMGNTCVPCHINRHHFSVQLPTFFCITTPEEVGSIALRNYSEHV